MLDLLFTTSTTTRRLLSVSTQASLTAAPWHTANTTLQRHSVVVLSDQNKKRVLHLSVPLIFKALALETCKNEASDSPPQKAVISRYLSATWNIISCQITINNLSITVNLKYQLHFCNFSVL